MLASKVPDGEKLLLQTDTDFIVSLLDKHSNHLKVPYLMNISRL